MNSVYLVTFKDPKRDGREGQYGLFIVVAETPEAARETAARQYGKPVAELEFSRSNALNPKAEPGPVFGLVYRPGKENW